MQHALPEDDEIAPSPDVWDISMNRAHGHAPPALRRPPVQLTEGMPPPASRQKSFAPPEGTVVSRPLDNVTGLTDLDIGALPPVMVSKRVVISPVERSDEARQSAGRLSTSPSSSLSIVAVTLRNAPNAPVVPEDRGESRGQGAREDAAKSATPQTAKLSLKERMAELRRKALMSMRRPDTPKTPVSVVPDRTEAVPASLRAGAWNEPTEMDKKEEKFHCRRMPKDIARSEGRPIRSGRRRPFKEVLQFEVSDSDIEPEMPYMQFYSAVRTSQRKLSPSEEVEEMKIRVVRLGKCPSELFAPFEQPAAKRPKVLPSSPAVHAKDGNPAGGSSLPEKQMTPLKKVVLSADPQISQNCTRMPVLSPCTPSSLHEKTAVAVNVAEVHVKGSGSNMGIGCLTLVQKSIVDRTDEIVVKSSKSNDNQKISGGISEPGDVIVGKATKVRELKVDASVAHATPDAMDTLVKNDCAEKVVGDTVNDVMSTKSSLPETDALAGNSLPCSPDEPGTETVTEIMPKASKQIPDLAEGVKKRPVVSSPSEVEELKRRIAILEKRRLLSKQKLENAKNDNGNDVEKKDASPMKALNGQGASKVRARYYDGASGKKNVGQVGAGVTSGGDSPGPELTVEVAKWNERDDCTWKVEVTDMADASELKDLKSQLEMSKRKLTSIQDNSRVMQMANVSVAQAEAKLSFSRGRVESMAEELKKAEREYQEAEENYQKVVEAARQMQSSLPQFADSEFSFPDLEVSGRHVGRGRQTGDGDGNAGASSSPGDNGIGQVGEQNVDKGGEREALGHSRGGPSAVDLILRPSPFSPSTDSNFVSCLGALRAYAFDPFFFLLPCCG